MEVVEEVREEIPEDVVQTPEVEREESGGFGSVGREERRAAQEEWEVEEVVEWRLVWCMKDERVKEVGRREDKGEVGVGGEETSLSLIEGERGALCEEGHGRCF
jgi:hypothetical protein